MKGRIKFSLRYVPDSIRIEMEENRRDTSIGKISSLTSTQNSFELHHFTLGSILKDDCESFIVI